MTTFPRLALPVATFLLAGAAGAAGLVTVQLSKGGATSPQSSVIGGDAVSAIEIDEALAGEEEDSGVLEVEGRGGVRASVNRSVASVPGRGSEGRDARRAASNPQLVRSFDGVNFFDQRFSNNGNQFSVEPPDQGLCVGAGFVVESANDVMRIFDTTGTLAVGPVDLNTFYGYPAAIDRTKAPLQFGPSITDPTCYFDKELRRFFHVVLTLDRASPTTQGLSGANHLDIAVSNSSNPTGSWTVFRLPVQNDGTQGTPDHGCVAIVNGNRVHGPCLGDYPHIGADANGIYLTTNEFNLAAPGFRGAQIYAISKRALTSRGSTGPAAVLFNTGDETQSAIPGFTVWPAQSPGDDDFEEDGRGTEYLLSSDAVFFPTGTSTELIVWSLSNTRSLNSAHPAPVLNAKAIEVQQYGVPPRSDQKPSTNLPLRDCIADAACRLLIGATSRRDNNELRLDSNDSRMQQVAFAKGKLWGALDTAVSVGGVTKAGIAYFVFNPRNGRISTQGTIAVAGSNVTYPAIGVTEEGRGVIAFTLLGADHFPSAGYASLDARTGAGAVHVAAEGVGPQDGFAGYLPFGTRSRWGDYGAAAADGDSVWIASEYVAQTCDFTQYKVSSPSSPFGTCGKTRGPLGNWATRISRIRPGERDDD